MKDAGSARVGAEARRHERALLRLPGHPCGHPGKQALAQALLDSIAPALPTYSVF